MGDYEEKTLKPLRRSILLRALDRNKDGTSNADLLLSFLNGTKDGVSAYYADIVGDLGWLETKGYVTLSGTDVVVVDITPRGRRIARGDNTDAGIARQDGKA
jgi:hypothetical protein